MARHRDLEDIVAQLDGSEPYYLLDLVRELRAAREELARLRAILASRREVA
jgi:hypothetical protein